MKKNNIGSMILRRLWQSVIILFIVTLIVFLLMQLVPGDPIVNYLGSNATKEQIQHYTQMYGFDQPSIVQYSKWVLGLFQGQMGHSVTYNKEVSDIIFTRLGTTLMVVLPAFVIAVVLGVFFGIIAALNRGKAIDSVISVIANAGMAMPMFWAGIIAILIFALNLKWLPVQGYVPPSQGVGNWLWHLVMPVCILALGPIAQFTRQTRSSMLEVIRQDYVRTAEAKGLDRNSIIFKHELRNALIPVITVMGVQLGSMIGGTVLVESIFNINGLGNLMITAIHSKDYMVVENGVFLISCAVAICNLLVDILYGIIDPRIRSEQ
jgi:peptide/nickel transport system permease protein